MTLQEVDAMYMRRCLQLAAKGLGHARPNPLVGCVVVKDGRIVSEGYHQEYGQNHAERNALLREGDFSGATLYVNLEPCSHYGKTPPCADLIIEKKIKRVVCCNDDPNPLVAGQGFAKLAANGIEIKRYVLKEEGRMLNRRFFTYMEKKRPYIILKWAESIDGFIAPLYHSEQIETSNNTLKLDKGKRYWLSSQQQNRLNHRWRTEEAAILVGSETYLQDHPILTPRHYLGAIPKPVVLDRRMRLTNLPPQWMHLHVETIEETLQTLYENKIQSVIVEGGYTVLQAFIESGFYDEVRILRSTQRIGNGIKAPNLTSINTDLLTIID